MGTVRGRLESASRASEPCGFARPTHRRSAEHREQLYPTHVPLSALGKLAVAAGSAVGAVLNPARADLVAAVGETTGESRTTA